MALTSYDAYLAAAAANKVQDVDFGKNSFTTTQSAPHSMWAATGSPTAGDFSGTAKTARQITSASTGAIRFTNAGGSDELQLISFGAVSTTTTAGWLRLVDRLLDYPGIDGNTASTQTLTNSVSLGRYTTGDGVMAFLETTTAPTHSATTFSISYTNQAGTSGRTSPNVTTVTNPILWRINHVHGFFIPLQAGDTGIRSVQSITFAGAGSTAACYCLTLCRPIAHIPIMVQNGWVERDTVLQTPRAPTIFDDAALQLLIWAGNTSSGTITGAASVAAG